MKLDRELFILNKKLSCITYKNMSDTAFSLYINELFSSIKENIIIVTPTLFEANKLLDELSNLNNNSLLFPMDDFLTSMAIAASPDFKITRLETLNASFSDKKHILVTHLMGILRFLPTKNKYQQSIINLDIEKVMSKYNGANYEIKD